jgi:hypothetical protein
MARDLMVAIADLAKQDAELSAAYSDYHQHPNFQPLRAAIARIREIAAVPANSEKPIRAIIDMSGGLFNGAWSTVPVDILVIDDQDGEHPRATVPGFTSTHSLEIWAGSENAEVNAEFVDNAFDGAVWLDEDS